MDSRCSQDHSFNEAIYTTCFLLLLFLQEHTDILREKQKRKLKSPQHFSKIKTFLTLPQCRTFERRGSVAVFQGHHGLVTALDWRPMAPPDPSVVFLSAALDDTLRVWHLDRRESHCVLKNPQV